MQFGQRLTPESFWERESALMDRVRLGAASLPVYGLAVWSAGWMLGDWNWQNGQLVSAGTVHGQTPGTGPSVEVTTTRHSATDLAAALFDTQGRGASGTDGIRRRDNATQPPPREHEFRVDSTTVTFGLWGSADRWWAAAQLPEYGLVIASREVAPDDVSLARVTDLAPYIDGRTRHLRALRGES